MPIIGGVGKLSPCQEKTAESRNLTGGQTKDTHSIVSHPRLGWPIWNAQCR